LVIISDRVGQLCNRLFHFSYFIANAIEYGYKVKYPCFDEYCEFFESTLTNSFFDLPVSTKITPSSFVDGAILKLVNSNRFHFPSSCLLDIRGADRIYDLKGESFRKLTQKKIIFTKGWLFKDEENLKKHRETLLQIFKPVKKYLDKVSDIISDLRGNFDCIIGIHVRRGDYLSWNEGKYFYSDEVYLKKMEQIEKEITVSGKSCCFFICSNEAVQNNIFAHLNTNIAQRHFIIDLYTLAECDYILGPPSTFSYWASFYGNKPLLILETEKVDITLDKFVYY
jgi:hypothetical protein